MERSEVAQHWEANADAWTRHVRAGHDIYRDALNTPAFLEMLPPIEGLSGLDIGCGEGTNTRQLARLGARVRGVDIAPTFIRHAQSAEAVEPLGIVFQTGDGHALPFEDCSFEFATAFMSLMDMPDQGRALSEAFRVLRPGGFLQFAILHPCFVPPHRNVLRNEAGQALGHRGRRLLRRNRRPGGSLVVRDPVRRGAREGRTVPYSAVSPDAERLGRDDRPSWFRDRTVRGTLRQ